MRSINNFSRRAWSRSHATRNGPEREGVEVKGSMTVQSSKDECDINVIVKRFGVTGMLPIVPMPPSAAEFSEVFDFQSAMNVVAEATQSFGALDANVRKRFNNDPHDYVQFCLERDKKGALVNLVEMRKMGLAVPEKEIAPVPPPLKVEVVNPVPAVK